MPCEPYPSASELPPTDKAIWRFMSLAKFLDLLSMSSLYFTQLRVLRRLDPFEGSATRRTRQFHELMESNDAFARAILKIPEDKPLPPGRAGLGPGHMKLVQEFGAASAYVNCWHLSERESASLWSAYASQTDGVAVKTTIGRFVGAIEKADDEINVGCVQYIDYERDSIPGGNSLDPVFRKRLSFKSDEEFRACLMKFGALDLSPAAWARNPKGVRVDCDLVQLIEEIRVSPLVEEWHVEVVKRVVQAHGYDFAVRRSEISDPAIF